jgi:hypothetical protein
MTLAELRTILRSLLFDDSETDGLWSNAQLNAFLNTAMQNVASWAVAMDPSYVSTIHEGTVNNTDGALRVFVSPEPYSRVRKILEAERSNPGSDDSPGLEIVAFRNTRSRIRSGLQPLPHVFLYGQQVGFLQPENNVAVRVYYVPVLPYMDIDLDTPGQDAGTGTANLLSEEFQVLIPTYAAILALTAENPQPATVLQNMQAIYTEQKAALAAALGERVRTPERG